MIRDMHDQKKIARRLSFSKGNLLSILAFEHQPTSQGGGQEISMCDSLAFLVKRGHRVDLGYQIAGDLMPTYQKIGVQTFSFTRNSIRFRPCFVLKDGFEFVQSLIKIMRRHFFAKYRLIYCNEIGMLPLAATASMLTKARLVCHVRILITNPCRQVKIALRRCDLMIANSQACASSIRAISPSMRIRTVHNGIDPERFKPNDDAVAKMEKNRVLYIGRISPEKGIESLIEAVSLARAENRNLRLRIVGFNDKPTTEYEAELRFKCQEFSEFVTLASKTRCPEDEYRNADLVVVPSIWEEAFGRVIIEAMACSIPVIASRVGGMPEILLPEFPEHLFRSGDIFELSNKITKIVQWREQDENLGRRCRDFVCRNFSLQTMGIGLEKALCETGALT